MLKYCTIALISHASKVMLKILQVRFQQYMNYELPDIQAVFRKAEEPEIKLPTSTGSSKKQGSSRKKHLLLLYYAKAFDCVDHNKLWKYLKEMGILDHLTRFLRNLYAGQEATVGTRHRTTEWFQIGKGVYQGCILSSCLFKFCAKYIMRNAGWMKHKLESRFWEKYQ